MIVFVSLRVDAAADDNSNDNDDDNGGGDGGGGDGDDGRRWHTDNNQLKEMGNQVKEQSTTSCSGRNVGGSGNVNRLGLILAGSLCNVWEFFSVQTYHA